MGDERGNKRVEIGLIPRVVAGEDELQQLLALSIPGYWNLPKCFSFLCPALRKTMKCPSDDQIFSDFSMEHMHNCLEGCPDLPVLEFQGSQNLNGSPVATFLIKSEVSEFFQDKDCSFYDYILTKDLSSIYGDHKSIPIEALFNDLELFDVVFPLNSLTKPKWSSQPELV